MNYISKRLTLLFVLITLSYGGHQEVLAKAIESTQLPVCESFFQRTTQILHIPFGESCRYTSELGTINEIQIHGKLFIEDVQSIVIAFNSLFFGEKGELYIGKESPITQNQIILEQVSPDALACESREPQGSLYVYSTPFASREFSGILKDRVVLDSDQDYSAFSFHQSVAVINTNYLNPIQVRKIGSTPTNELFLDQQLNRTEYSDTPQLHPIWQIISGMRKEKGVILKNICLSVKENQIQGALFLNARGLHFSGDLIENSLFANQGISYSERRFKFQTKLINNIFSDSENISLSIKSGDFTQNTVLNVKKLAFSQIAKVSKSLFVNCTIQFHCEEIDVLRIHKSKFILTNASLHSANFQYTSVQIIDSQFFEHSSISGTDPQHKINQFVIEGLESSKSYLKVSENALRTISISNSSIACFDIPYFKIISNQKFTNAETKIRLTNVTIFEINNKVFEYLYCSFCSSHSIGDVDILYSIEMVNVTTHFKSERSFLFEFPKMRILNGGSSSRYMVKLIHNAYRPPYSTLPKIQYIQDQEQLYECNYSYASFSFKEIRTFSQSSADFKIKGIQQEYFSQNLYPVFSNQTLRVFLDEFDLQDVPTIQTSIDSFKIELYEKREQDLRVLPKTIEFFSEKAILDFTLLILDNSSQTDSEIMKECNDYIDWFFDENSVKVQFTNIPCGSIKYFVSFDYCKSGFKRLNNQCVEICPRYQLGSYCVSKCSGSNFVSIVTKENCFECLEYCSECEAYCKNCPPYLIKSQQKCVLACQRNEVQIGDQCFQQNENID